MRCNPASSDSPHQSSNLPRNCRLSSSLDSVCAHACYNSLLSVSRPVLHTKCPQSIIILFVCDSRSLSCRTVSEQTCSDTSAPPFSLVGVLRHSIILRKTVIYKLFWNNGRLSSEGTDLFSRPLVYPVPR